MNTRQKGSRAEIEYSQLLESQGFIVERVKGSTKFVKQVDFFGIADLIALGADGIKLIQIKSNATAGALKKLKIWKETNKSSLPQNLSLEVAVRKDGCGGRSPVWKTYQI